MCKKIDHFPEDADYEQDTAEYLLRKDFTLHDRAVCCSTSMQGV